MYIYISTSLFIYLYIYTYVNMYICTYIYIRKKAIEGEISG